MFQSDLFKGRTILITGGGTGLGRSMALRFAELGANIFLVARREEPLKETTEAIRAKGARAAYASGRKERAQLMRLRTFAISTRWRRRWKRPKKNLAA